MNVKLHRLTKLESRIINLYSDGKYNQAIELAKELLESAKKSEDIKAMMNAYLNIASCYYYLGQIESAFENVLQYKLLCDEYGDDRDKFHLYNLSALIYEFEENYEDAKKAISACIDLALELEMFYSATVSYNTYSTYFMAEENFNKAFELANKAMSLAKTYCPSDILLHCQIFINIAASQIGMRNFKEAKEILEPLNYNPYMNSNLHEKGYYLYVYATLYKELKNYEQALTFLEDAKNIFLSYNDQIMIKTISKEISNLYEHLGNYEQAFMNLKDYIYYAEKLFKLRLSSKIKELDIKHSVSAIEKRANIDSLTGVYNRYYLEKTCNKWLKDAIHSNSHICCIIFDVDHFKKINDTYGHLVGDEVIKSVGKTFSEVVFESEDSTIVSRYGGDEFVAILKDYSADRFLQKAKQLFTALTNLKIPYLNNIIKVTVSMGIVCTENLPTVKKFTQLFKLADQALYTAKKEGRNQIVSLSRENCYRL